MAEEDFTFPSLEPLADPRGAEELSVLSMHSGCPPAELADI